MESSVSWKTYFTSKHRFSMIFRGLGWPWVVAVDGFSAILFFLGGGSRVG